MKRSITTLALVAIGASPYASVINMSLFSTAYSIPNSQVFHGFARDRSTGVFYRSQSYIGTQVYQYSNVTDFQADTGSTLTTLDDVHLGAYGVVRNGKYFSRSNTTTGSVVSRFDASTGTIEIMQNFAGIDPTNGSATFDWGGYSTLNLFEDATGFYMYGKDMSGNHTMSKLDDNLNILSSYQFSGSTGSDPSFGYAFDIKGHLFLGQDFSGTGIQTRVNLATGLTSSVNFTLGGMGSPVYISDAYYDDLDDRLYVFGSYGYEMGTEGLYCVDHAAEAFGVVPEPGSIVCLGVGLAAMMRVRRRSPRG